MGASQIAGRYQLFDKGLDVWPGEGMPISFDGSLLEVLVGGEYASAYGGSQGFR